ncbi:hypothetical protein [Demequina sp. NBRC 110056]|uniref:hypothetical protein n=1 Tax=Demequina sp. NBRC 110056 TaxID=1570345 RepID=UPI0009FCB8A4|nr:hypothetical protein [Demequina sp. NBRC 110056]
MRDLPTELARLRDDHARRLDGARPPEEWRRTVRRNRARRGALWAGGAAVAVALLSIAALPGPSSAPPAAADASDPIPDVLPTTEPVQWELATVRFGAGEDWLDDPLLEGPPQCGQPLPASMSARDGFRAEHEVPDQVIVRAGGYGSPAQASTTIRYGRYDEFPVVVDPLVGLVAQDGIVVGWLTPSARRGVTTFADAYPSTQHWVGLATLALACGGTADPGPGAAMGPLARLEAGDYEVAWMTRVHATEEANARADLAGRGFAVPPTSLLTAYREGSYECDLAREQPRASLPLTCDPDAVPGTTVDLEGGTVTFPYRAESFGRAVDVTFVTEPVAMTIYDVAPNPRVRIERQNPPHVAGEPMECGATYGGLNESAVRLSWSEPTDSIAFGSRELVDVWVAGRDWSAAAVLVPDGGTLWLTERIDRRAALDDGGSYGYTLHEVVGSAPIAVEPRIEIDRYVGPTTVTVSLGDIEWCERPSPVPTASLTFSLVAPHTVVTGSGVETYEVLRIE